MKLKRPDFRSLEDMVLAAAEMVRPPERLTVSEAAAKYRYLENPGSYVGYWPNEKTPYLAEPMDLLTSLEYTGMIFVGPARTGKSDMFFNWLTYGTICDPADMMRVDMTKDVARDWSIGDLAKMLRHSKEVGKRLVPGRQNDNVHDKRFKSGMRLLIKWPTITEVSGKTLPRGWIADYDRIEGADDVAKEGPLFDLVRKRTTTFKRHGMTVAESSPGREIKDANWIPRTPHAAPPTDGGILELYNRGDRRRWYWRCLKCRKPFEADFDLFDYPLSEDLMESAEAVRLVCPNSECGFRHDSTMKPELQEHIRNARWVRDGMLWLPDGSIQGRPERTDIGSFWLKGPAAAFQSWESLVFSYLQARRTYDETGNEGPLKKTVTADQGNAYLSKSVESSRLPEELRERASDWGGSKEEPVVPPGTRFLVATIDVQAGGRPKFVVQVHAVLEGGDFAIVDMFKIEKSLRLDEDGHPHLLDPAAYPEDWRLIVERVIERSYPLSDGSGREMRIKFTGCDSGGAEGVTTNAYRFWRWLRDEHPAGHHRRFLLIKGDPAKFAPRIRITYPDSGRKDRHSGARGDVPVLMIHSTTLKDTVYGMLGRAEPGGGMVSYPHWAPDWLYQQLLAEVRTAKGWENPRKKRNEAWDCLVYAFAICLHQPIRIERLDWTKPPRWADEWDRNDLVFDPLSTPSMFDDEKPVEYDLSAMANRLA